MSTIDTAAVGNQTVNLSDLNNEQRYEIFDRLQRNLPAVWDAMRLNLENESVVVIPSVTLDRLSSGSGSMTQAYEERFLFLLLLLREPRLRMVYVTSTPIAPTIIEYYLALLPGVIPSHARARLTLVSVGDSTPDRSAKSCSSDRGSSAGSPPSSRTHRYPTSSRTTPPSSSVTSPSPLGYPCTVQTPGWCTSARRPAAGASSPKRAFAILSGRRMCTISMTSRTP